MRGKYAKACKAQHIQLLGSCKLIRRPRCYSIVALCILSIHWLLSARHPLVSFAKYLTNPMKLTNLHKADGSRGGGVRPILTSHQARVLCP